MVCGANSNGCSLGQCSCINGFSGKLCDIPSGCAVTESPCQNSARIISCSGNSVVCACNDGFGGELCETCDLCSAGGGSPNADCSECLGCPDNRGGKTCDLEPVEFMIRLNNVNLVEATGEELSTSFRAAFVRDVAFTLGLPRTSVRVSRVDASGPDGVTVRFFVFRRSNEGLLLDATFTNSLLFQLREPHQDSVLFRGLATRHADETIEVTRCSEAGADLCAGTEGIFMKQNVLIFSGAVLGGLFVLMLFFCCRNTRGTLSHKNYMNYE
eukprot:534896_1